MTPLRCRPTPVLRRLIVVAEAKTANTRRYNFQGSLASMPVGAWP